MLGEIHPDTLDTIIGLANTYAHQSRYVEAKRTYKQCLDKTRTTKGDSKRIMHNSNVNNNVIVMLIVICYYQNA